MCRRRKMSPIPLGDKENSGRKHFCFLHLRGVGNSILTKIRVRTRKMPPITKGGKDNLTEKGDTLACANTKIGAPLFGGAPCGFIRQI